MIRDRVEGVESKTRKIKENNYSARAEEIGRNVSSADEVEVIENSADASRPYLPGCYSFSETIRVIV